MKGICHEVESCSPFVSCVITLNNSGELQRGEPRAISEALSYLPPNGKGRDNLSATHVTHHTANGAHSSKTKSNSKSDVTQKITSKATINQSELA